MSAPKSSKSAKKSVAKKSAAKKVDVKKPVTKQVVARKAVKKATVAKTAAKKAGAADLLDRQHGGFGDRLKPLTRDWLARHDRVAVRANFDTGQRLVDVANGLAGLARQQPIKIALDNHRVAFATFVIKLHIAHFAVFDQRDRFFFEAGGSGQLAGATGQ